MKITTEYTEENTEFYGGKEKEEFSPRRGERQERREGRVV